jgi:hypothetical protein
LISPSARIACWRAASALQHARDRQLLCGLVQFVESPLGLRNRSLSILFLFDSLRRPGGTVFQFLLNERGRIFD